jgi:hypothetical protein
MRSLFGERLSCGSISMYKARRQIYGQSLETPHYRYEHQFLRFLPENIS